MKFTLIETVQTANGLAFEDQAGNRWVVLKLYNVTTGQVVLLPSTTAVKNSMIKNTITHHGLKVVDQATYKKWADLYQINCHHHHHHRGASIKKRIIDYVKKQSATLYETRHTALQKTNGTKTSYI